jgi:hypothetical protein
MTLAPDEVSAARAEVRRLMGQQNRSIAIAFAVGGAGVVLATYFGFHSNWVFIAWMVGCRLHPSSCGTCAGPVGSACDARRAERCGSITSF